MATRSLPEVLPTYTPGAYTPANIIVFLDEVKILGGTDSGLMPSPGEIQIMSVTATGDKVQKTKFPRYNWYEAGNGDTIGVGQPIFCLPEDQMGDVLMLGITVVDNDDTAQVYQWALENLPGPIASYLVSLALSPGVAAASAGGGPAGAAAASLAAYAAQTAAQEAADALGDAFAKWLGSAKKIGSHGHGFTREEGWGAPATSIENSIGKQYVFTAKNAVFTY